MNVSIKDEGGCIYLVCCWRVSWYRRGYLFHHVACIVNNKKRKISNLNQSNSNLICLIIVRGRQYWPNLMANSCSDHMQARVNLFVTLLLCCFLNKGNGARRLHVVTARHISLLPKVFSICLITQSLFIYFPRSKRVR